jgi:hypothetical protein
MRCGAEAQPALQLGQYLCSPQHLGGPLGELTAGRAENRKKYVMAAIFLVLSLVSFVVF